QETGEISDGQKPKGITEEPNADGLQGRRGHGGLREAAKVHKFREAAERRQAEGRDHESDLTAEQDAGDDDDEEIERTEIAVLKTGGIDNAADHDHITGNLQRAEPRSVGKQTDQD